MRTALKTFAIIQLAWTGLGLFWLAEAEAMDFFTFLFVATLLTTGILVLVYLNKDKKE